MLSDKDMGIYKTIIDHKVSEYDLKRNAIESGYAELFAHITEQAAKDYINAMKSYINAMRRFERLRKEFITCMEDYNMDAGYVVRKMDEQVIKEYGVTENEQQKL